MTALAAWITYSDLGPRSAYIATDSRISWGPSTTWDRGKKCFASTTFPDIFGYVGDVLLPSVLLGQVCSLLDSGGVLQNASLEDRRTLLASVLAEAVRDYPDAHFHPFTVVHVGRGFDSDGETEFQISTTAVDASKRVQNSTVLSHSRASVLALGGRDFVQRHEKLRITDGSGSAIVDRFVAEWAETEDAHTSRTVFASLCEAIDSKSDPLVGGPAQLVGLYGKGAGKNFGFLDGEGRAFIDGLPIADTQRLSQKLPFRRSDFTDLTRTGRPRH